MKSVSKVIVNAKRQYFASKIESAKNNKTLFSLTNELLGASKTKSFPSVFPQHELSQVFCDFFINKVKDIRSKLNNLNAPNPIFNEYCGPLFTRFQSVSEKDIKEIIMESPPKSCSLDPLPTCLVRENVDVLAPLITQIINLSLVSGVVPKALKRLPL